MKNCILSLATVLLTVVFLSIPGNAQQPLVFGSDVHGNHDNPATYPGITNFTTIINNYVKVWNPEFYGLAGDNVRKTIDGTNQQKLDDWNAVLTVAGTLPCQHFFSMGNNDLASTCYNQYSMVVWNGIFADIFEISSPEFILASTQNLIDTWLAYQRDQEKNGKLKIIMCHFPLHTLKTDVNLAAATKYFNIISKYSGTNMLDIIWIWGHTHDKDNVTGLAWDQGINMIAPRGTTSKMANTYNDKIHHPNANKPLTFTYANAGYISIPGKTSAQFPGHILRVKAERTNRDYFKLFRDDITTEVSIKRQDPNRTKWQ